MKKVVGSVLVVGLLAAIGFGTTATPAVADSGNYPTVGAICEVDYLSWGDHECWTNTTPKPLLVGLSAHDGRNAKFHLSDDSAMWDLSVGESVTILLPAGLGIVLRDPRRFVWDVHALIVTSVSTPSVPLDPTAFGPGATP